MRWVVGQTKTCAQQRLVFDYMIRFERIRNQGETGWVAQSREWHWLGGAVTRMAAPLVVDLCSNQRGAAPAGSAYEHVE